MSESRAEQAKAEGRTPTRGEVRADIYSDVVAAMALLERAAKRTKSYWPAHVRLTRLLSEEETNGVMTAMEQLHAVALSLRDQEES